MAQKLSKEKRDNILTQSIEEYDHALEYRQKRELNWLSVDELYYGKKKKSLVTRANIHVPKMQGGIETFVSKIDDSPFIRYEAQEEADRPKAMKMNGLQKHYSNKNDWDLTDLIGKKQGALYGRCIYKKFSSSEGGFQDFFFVVSTADFLIDPLAGGLKPMIHARYMGHDNIIKSKWDLQDKIYDKEVVDDITSKLTTDSQTDDKYATRQRRRESLGLSQATLINEESVKLTEWITTFEGERYYCLFSREHSKSVRTVRLTEVFGSDTFPYATWAPFPRLDEFWTPGVGELFKEVNIAQNIILSQILDNNAFRNYGMKAYDSSKVPNPADLKPRPMGKVPVNGRPQDIIMDIKFPSLDNAGETYKLLESIFDKESGITAQARGVPNTKRMSATEFSGLLDQVADKFFLNSKLYKSALRRIAELFYYGIEENLTKAQRIRILGTSGVEWVKVSAEDVKAEFDIQISTGTQEENNKNLARDRMREYVRDNRENPRLNQRFLDEREAEVMGFDMNEIQRLLNPDLEADWETLSEAVQENQDMLNKDVKPNRTATTGHIEKHLEFLRTTQDLKPEVINRVLEHARLEIPMAEKNAQLKVSSMIKEKVDSAVEGVQPQPQSPALGGVDTGAPVDLQGQVQAQAVQQAPVI